MRYCPYCGADFADEAFSFCPECGKQIPARQELPGTAEKEERRKQTGRKREKKHSRKEKVLEKKTEEIPLPEEDGYDGYYDDILPVDAGKIRQGIDKEMVKRIAGLLIGVLIVICACVAIMYLL